MIAEPAIYWHGDINLLQDMAAVAAASQADYFKLQLFSVKYLTKKFKAKESFYSSCQLDDGQLQSVKQLCERLGLKLLVTVMTPDQLPRIQSLNIKRVKIASGQTCERLIDGINQFNWEEVFVSTGMTDEPSKLDNIHKIDCGTVNVMHCVSLYPHYDNETNMMRFLSIQEYLGDKYHYGYSDHAVDDLPCLVAVSMGAEFIEKHFKINGCFGPTSQVCASPDEMGNLGALLRRIDAIKGDGCLTMQPREWNSFEHYKNRFVF